MKIVQKKIHIKFDKFHTFFFKIFFYSALPTNFPSTVPTKRPTSNACAEADPWTIGSELIRVNDEVSVFTDTE